MRGEQRVPGAQRIHQARYGGGGAGHGGYPDPAVEARPHGGDLVLQSVPVGQDLMRPYDDAFTLGGQAVEAASPLDERDLEFLFQLADGLGQGGLGHPAALCGVGEVPLPRQSDQVFELPEEHGLNTSRHVRSRSGSLWHLSPAVDRRMRGTRRRAVIRPMPPAPDAPRCLWKWGSC
jgi:hypothetical protein